ncbi:surface lipoprotein assembly modifier [Acinetobacter puyangensis]|uniref:surface lipoprotein assembly modifier n=1 Tax=Acinetobacter puyangensis TaxID=1096779 RepID=UPI003A4DBEFC
MKVKVVVNRKNQRKNLLLLMTLLMCLGGVNSHANTTTKLPEKAIQPLDNLDRLSPDFINKDRLIESEQKRKRNLETQQKIKEQEPVKITDEDVKNNPNIAEIIINESIQNQDWKTLEKVLALYQQSPDHDPMAVLYAQGALFRHQGKLKQAIKSFQKMLETDSSLDYVRFDVAAMMFENGQYRDAEQILTRTKNNSQIERGFRVLAEQLLNQINEYEKVKGKARLRIIHNDNVNQATDLRDLYINGERLVKRDENMPQSSMGTNYALDLQQSVNIQGNHSFNWNLRLNGLSYASMHDYDEQNIGLEFGYKWQDVNSWFSIGPIADWRWLNKRRYINAGGVAVEYGTSLNPEWQFTLNGTWLNKSYKDPIYYDFEGNGYTLSTNLIHVLSQDSFLLGGLSFNKDDLNLDAEKFDGYGANLGYVKDWKNGFNFLTFNQFGLRKYDGKDAVFGTVREDKYFNAVINVGHKKLNFWKVEPKVGFQYEYVNSNIDEFFTKITRQWMLTFERKF